MYRGYYWYRNRKYFMFQSVIHMEKTKAICETFPEESAQLMNRYLYTTILYRRCIFFVLVIHGYIKF